jgi:hypothetical protein
MFRINNLPNTVEFYQHENKLLKNLRYPIRNNNICLLSSLWLFSIVILKYPYIKPKWYFQIEQHFRFFVFKHYYVLSFIYKNVTQIQF